MKRFLTVFLIISLSILIGTYALQEDSFAIFLDSGSLELEYRNVDIEESHEIVMDSDDYLEVSVKNDKGQIKISIKDSNGNEVYSSCNLPTSEFSVQIEKADTYTIEVNGHNVSGELSIFRVRNS